MVAPHSLSLKKQIPSCMHAYMISHGWLFVIPQTVAHKTPLSMGSPRQEYWSGLPFPSPGDIPGPGIITTSPALAGGFFTTEPPRKSKYLHVGHLLAVLKPLKMSTSNENAVINSILVFLGNREQVIKLGQEYTKAVYCNLAYLS